MSKFNPQKAEKITISLRIDENILKKIDKLSTKRDISRNEFLVQCIEFALINIVDDDNKSQ